MPAILDRSVGVDIAQDAVKAAIAAGADGAKALHRYRERFEVNFDTNDVTLVRSTVADTITLTVLDGTKKGSIEISGRAPDLVKAAARQALEAAQAGQPDPANVMPEEAAEPATHRGAEEPDKEAMVDAVLQHLKRMQGHPLLLADSSSNYAFTCSWSSYANSHGRVQHARRSRYAMQAMLTARDGKRATSFNYATQISDEPTENLTELTAVKALIDETLASFDAKPIPATFVGDVIFTPQVLGTVVGSVAGALSGTALIRGTSPYADQLGQRIAPVGFTLAHRPSALPGASAFDSEGFANDDMSVITDGVLDHFLIDWYMAQKLSRPMTTGSADFVVSPGDVALDDLIAKTERGILLGRYSGSQPNQNLEFSGVAKNSFYIEDGKVQFPINETMVAGNFRSVLESISGISRETIDFGSASYPWVASTGVTVSTK